MWTVDERLSLGKRMIRYRQAAGMSIGELSKKSKISKSAISLYENNKRSPRIEKLMSIADALDLSLDELVGRRKS